MKNESVGTASPQVRSLLVGAGPLQLAVAIGVGLCCSAAVLLTVGSPLNQAGTVDAFFYAGYISDYHHLLERFGPKYYSERVAFIYPQSVLTHLLGLEGGYFAFRFIALASAVAAAFAIGKRFYGYGPAILAAVWLSFIPWLPRELLWTYPDGVAVVYLLVGVAFLLVPVRGRWAWNIAAGAAFALAVNCNLILLAIGGLLSPGWAFFYRRKSVGWLAQAILALAVGFFAAYLAVALILYVQFPRYGFSFELATIRESIYEMSGRGVDRFEPLSTMLWTDHNFTLLIPFTFMVAICLVAAQKSTIVGKTADAADFVALAVSYVAIAICFLLVLHFAFHDASLSLPFYTSYLLPGCVLALIVLGGEAERRGGPIFGPAAVFGGAGLILVTWLARPLLPTTEIVLSANFWLSIAAITAGAALALRRIAAASAVLIPVAALLSLCLYWSGAEDSAHRGFYDVRKISPRAEEEWDVYRGAIFLQQFVDADVNPNQSIGFWYSNSRDLPRKYLNSIQSVYLWGYTRMFPFHGPGMPTVDEQFRGDVAGQHFLVLLGLSDAETNAGLAALEAAELPFQEVKRARFQGRVWGYTAVLIEMKPPVRTLGPFVYGLPMADLKASGGGELTSLSDGIRLITAAPRWGYSLVGRLRAAQESAQGAAVVRIRVRVEKGEVGVAISAAGNISDLIREISVDARTEPHEFYIDIPELSATDLFIIRNHSPDGPSRAVIYSVDVFRPK